MGNLSFTLSFLVSLSIFCHAVQVIVVVVAVFVIICIYFVRLLHASGLESLGRQ